MREDHDSNVCTRTDPVRSKSGPPFQLSKATPRIAHPNTRNNTRNKRNARNNKKKRIHKT